MEVLSVALRLIIYILIGFGARKMRVIADGFDRMLTRFLMAIPLPCMIVNSFQLEFSPQDLMKAPVLLGLSLLSMAACFILAHLVSRCVRTPLRRAVRFALLFTNFTFLGLSVVSEVYGQRGAFNYVLFTLLIRILFYGGAPLLLGERGAAISGKQLLRQFLSEPVAAVFIGFLLYVTRLRLPTLAVSVLSSLGAMASPIGLMLCGIIIADAKLDGILKYPCAFWVTALRLLVLPAVMVGFFLLLRIDREIVQTTVYYYAMPVAAFLPSFLLRYAPENTDARTAAGYMVMLSTLLCIVTIPLWTVLLGLI